VPYRYSLICLHSNLTKEKSFFFYSRRKQDLKNIEDDPQQRAGGGGPRNPSYLGGEAGGSKVPGQPGQHSETLSQRQTRKQMKRAGM
jgi:hypothetical protein